VAVLAFDLTSSISFNKLRDIFIPLLQDSVDNCLTVVVGTKQDLLETESRAVRRSEGVELAVQQHQFQLQRALKHTPNTFLKDIDGSKLYYETSSKTGKGVDELFEAVKTTLLADLEKTSGGASKKAAKSAKDTGASVKLGEQTDGPTSSGGKCCGGN
jgi:GTPase SAR1 family protein